MVASGYLRRHSSPGEREPRGSVRRFARQGSPRIFHWEVRHSGALGGMPEARGVILKLRREIIATCWL